MSTKPCGNCEKTVYINEKIDVERQWYHRACFKCMAPGFVVCKDHVPLPRHSLTAEALALQHAANAPKPSVPGLFRTVVGERVADIKEGEPVIGYHYDKPESPRSLDQGSHAEIMKSLRASQYHDKGKGDGKEDNCSTPTSTLNRTYSGSTLPKYRQGRFTVPAMASDPEAVPHLEAEESQGSTRDENSFRTLPVRHSDYEYQDQRARQSNVPGQENDQDSWDDDRNWEDNKQERIFTMKETNMGGEASEKSLENLAFSSKWMEHKNHENGQSKAVDDDEWDVAPTNDLGRREIIAGIPKFDELQETANES
ncbi:MAG: hypothetical protein J3Q66DRAFT_397447 [Benniella sp.]|nr:MAG: hypothetical protein J3Q66DRAFT_397447 [Benniella sp.]